MVKKRQLPRVFAENKSDPISDPPWQGLYSCGNGHIIQGIHKNAIIFNKKVWLYKNYTDN
ncbi:MAG: hypothetical protein CTY34_09590 [Methylobacter sp.]|nr:MAG: hypothetical protein CTY34_09590 [Methylobacter sp.]PPD18593.1 MAG: hypothetical protein CTY24_12715 [Methylobacter sp.]